VSPLAKVVVLEPVAAEGLDLMREAGLEVVDAARLDPVALDETLNVADAVVIRSATQAKAEFLARCPRLRAVGRAGVGLDNVDLTLATERGVAVINTPGGNSVAAAEHTLALMLAVARHVPAAHASVAQGQWDRHRFVGVELAERTLGLVGVGRIGSLVAERARAFGMEVIAVDPFLTEERCQALGVEKVDLDTLLSRADVISLHVPLTGETRGLIGASTLGKMKRGVLLVNCARGGLVDEAALAQALREGRVGGVALDVFGQEPPTDSPLRDLPGVVHTPHLGASTREAKANVSVTIARAMIALLRDGDYSSAVNMPFAGPQLREMQPLLDLAQRLGRFQGGLLEDAPERIEIELAARDALDPGPLVQAFLCGLLETVVGGEVNAINASAKADQLGIVVSTGRRPPEPGLPRLVCTRVEAGDQVREVDGGMLAPHTPRIVRVDGLWMDVEPVGDLLVMWNADIPGVVGKVATLLGAEDINIGELRLGRDPHSHQAISVWQVDDVVDAEVRRRLQEVEDIEDVRQVRLGPARPIRK
jgi:D-3-phosphoglycerate dehydrogenase